MRDYTRSVWALLGIPLASLISAAAAPALIIDGTGSSDTLYGTTSFDTIHGLGGNDTIHGLAGSDSLFGDAGRDIFEWNDGDGSDFIEGGPDTDVLRVTLHPTADDDLEITSSGSRVYVHRSNLTSFTLDVGTVESFSVEAGGGNDVLTAAAALSGVPSLNLDGGPGDDVVTGSDGSETLRGGEDQDTLIGRGGDDYLTGGDGDDLFLWNVGDGSDLIMAGNGVDTLRIEGSPTGDDDFDIALDGFWVEIHRTDVVSVQVSVSGTERLALNAGGGDDMITGSSGLAGVIALELDGGDGDDHLVGGDGDDVLRGGADYDLLYGAEGADDLDGGAGNDLFVWWDGHGDDVVEGGPGTDRAQVILDPTVADQVSIVPVTTPDGDRVRVQRSNLTPITLDFGAVEIFQVLGRGGNDAIAASPGMGSVSLELDGGDGENFLGGGDGDDVLRGGTGDDVLLGGAGDDSIASGGGWNVHQGGPGVDRFVLGSDAYDEITDYEPGESIVVRGPFGSSAPNLRAGDDLFDLGYLEQWTNGADTAIALSGAAGASPFLRLDGVVGTFHSDPDDPFVIFLPEPGAQLQLAAGLASLVLLGAARERRRMHAGSTGRHAAARDRRTMANRATSSAG